MKLFILLNCKKATHICDRAQYGESSRWEKLLFKTHRLMCKLCREHSHKNNKLTHNLKEAQLKCLSPAEKEALKSRLNEKMA
jgi:hypothetical protein